MFSSLQGGSYQNSNVGGVLQSGTASVGHPFHHEFFMILNFALDRGNYGGTPSQISETQLRASLPAYMEVEWVRVYTLDKDPWGDPTQLYPGRRSHNN